MKENRDSELFKMNEEEFRGCFSIVLGAMIFFVVLAFGIGYHVGGYREQKKATEAGAGRWFIDKTGSSEFKYGCERRP